MCLVSVEQLPVISIVLPMRNAADTIDECLRSIAIQSFPDFEVVIVDDGSEDDSLSIVQRWRRHDRRIRLFCQDSLGLVAALNQGLVLARGRYVARMDADDIMHETRLQSQLDYFIQNPAVDLVAAQVELFSDGEIKAGYREYVRWQNSCVSFRDIGDEIYVESPIAHPSIMVRRDVFEKIGGYRQGDFPEDYELWLRMLHGGMRLEKVPQVLLKWREYASRTSRTDDRYHKDKFNRLRACYLKKDLRLSNRPLVFWGAGRKTRKRTNLLGIKPMKWIDIDPKKIGNTHMGVPVVSPAWLRTVKSNYEKPFVLSYVTNHGAREIIADELQANGFARGEDFLMVG